MNKSARRRAVWGKALFVSINDLQLPYAAFQNIVLPGPEKDVTAHAEPDAHIGDKKVIHAYSPYCKVFS
jgi:hypothetical protein